MLPWVRFDAKEQFGGIAVLAELYRSVRVEKYPIALTGVIRVVIAAIEHADG